MYKNADALIRPELNAVVEEAQAADSYFIATKVFPIYNSPRKTGEFYKFTKSTTELMKKNISLRAPKGGYSQVDRTWTKDSFACVDRGLEEPLDDAVGAEMASFFSQEETAAKLVLRAITMDLELRVAAEVFNASNFDSNNGSVAYTEANLATIDFAKDVMAALKLVKQRGEMVNTMVMNRNVYDRVRRSTKLAQFVFGPNGGGQQINEQVIAKTFGIPTLLIADATYDTAKKGQSPSLSYVWGDDYVWIGNVQGGDFAAGGAGRTIVWNGDAPSLFVTESYRKEEIRSDVIRVRTNTDEKVINTAAGTLIGTQYS